MQLDRRMLGERGIDRVVMLPTADAFEQPTRLVDRRSGVGRTRIGVAVEPLMVLTRAEADDPHAAAVVDGAQAVFLAGDSASHLRSVLKDTPLFRRLSRPARSRRHADRLRSVRGGTVRSDDRPARRRVRARARARPGAGRDPRLRSWPREQLERAHTHADTPLVDLPTGSAMFAA